MNKKSDSQLPSFDGQIRLPLHSLKTIALSHLHSDLYDQISTEDGFKVLHGYTEWASDDKQALSVGWDFSIKLTKPAKFRIEETPFTNIRFIDDSSTDLTDSQNAEKLLELISLQLWQETIVSNLGLHLPS